MTRTTQTEALPLKSDIGALANRINASTQSIHTKIDKQMGHGINYALSDYRVYRQGIQVSEAQQKN